MSRSNGKQPLRLFRPSVDTPLLILEFLALTDAAVKDALKQLNHKSQANRAWRDPEKNLEHGGPSDRC